MISSQILSLLSAAFIFVALLQVLYRHHISFKASKRSRKYVFHLLKAYESSVAGHVCM